MQTSPIKNKFIIKIDHDEVGDDGGDDGSDDGGDEVGDDGGCEEPGVVEDMMMAMVTPEPEIHVAQPGNRLEL